MHIKSYCAAHRHGLFSPQSNTGRAVLSLAFALVLTVVGLISIFDTDKTVSEEENRTFPFRDEFLGLNRKISEILTGTKGSGDIVLVSKQDKDDFAGQDID